MLEGDINGIGAEKYSLFHIREAGLNAEDGCEKKLERHPLRNTYGRTVTASESMRLVDKMSVRASKLQALCHFLAFLNGPHFPVGPLPKVLYLGYLCKSAVGAHTEA